MEVKHCGQVLSPIERELKITPDEEARGLIKVIAREYWCPDPRCRKRLFYRKDITKGGEPEFSRVRPHQIKSFRARLRKAKESDWVMSSRKQYPFTPVKAWVE